MGQIRIMFAVFMKPMLYLCGLVLTDIFRLRFKSFLNGLVNLNKRNVPLLLMFGLGAPVSIVLCPQTGRGSTYFNIGYLRRYQEDVLDNIFFHVMNEAYLPT